MPAANSAQLVSSAAQAAVGSVCWWCGYGGSLRRLVASNADYVVDGMCAQLRQVRLPAGPPAQRPLCWAAWRELWLALWVGTMWPA